MPIPYRKEYVKSDGRKLLGGGPRDLQRRQMIGSESSSMDPELVNILKEQIVELKEALKQARANKVPEGYFSPEEVDEEIRKAVEEAVKETMVSMKKNSQNLNQNLEPRLQSYKEQILKLQKQNDDFKTTQKSLVEQNSELQKKTNRLESELQSIEEYKNKIVLLEQTIESKNEIIETLKSRPIVVKGSAQYEEEDPDAPKRPEMERKFIDPLDKDAGKGFKSNIKFSSVEKDDKVDEKVNKLKNLLGGGLPRR